MPAKPFQLVEAWNYLSKPERTAPSATRLAALAAAKSWLRAALRAAARCRAESPDTCISASLLGCSLAAACAWDCSCPARSIAHSQAYSQWQRGALQRHSSRHSWNKHVASHTWRCGRGRRGVWVWEARCPPLATSAAQPGRTPCAGQVQFVSVEQGLQGRQLSLLPIVLMGASSQTTFLTGWTRVHSQHDSAPLHSFAVAAPAAA